MQASDTNAVKAAVERLKELAGQDSEALGILLDYAREQHATAKRQRKVLADANAFALVQHCFCVAGHKCDRCRLIAKMRSVME